MGGKKKVRGQDPRDLIEKVGTKVDLSNLSPEQHLDPIFEKPAQQKKELTSTATNISTSSKRTNPATAPHLDGSGMMNVSSRLQMKPTSINHNDMYGGDGNSQSPRNSGVYEPAQLKPLTEASKGYSGVASEPKLAKSKNEENLEYIDKFLMDFGQAGKEKIDATVVKFEAELERLNKDIAEKDLQAQKRNVQKIVENASEKAGIPRESKLSERGEEVKVESVAEVAARVANELLGPVVAQEVQQLMEKPIENKSNLSGVKLTSTDKLRVLGERFKLFCKHCHEYLHRKSDEVYVGKHRNGQNEKTAKEIFQEKYKNIPKEAEANIKNQRLDKQRAKDLKQGVLPI